MTDSDPQAESVEAVEARAADFLQRRLLRRWSEKDQAELNVWLDDATLHRVTYLRLEAGVARVEGLSDLRPPRLHRVVERLRLSFMAPFLASAVAAGLIAVFGSGAWRYFLPPPDHTYSTEVGGRALLNFADHTQIELNTNTVVHYRMTTRERTVWFEKGEAWFHVAHDAANPFTVIVGTHRVTDLGTEFVVRRSSRDMEVALLKGRAALSTDGAQTALLAPGDEAVATPVSMSVTKKTAKELADELAWRRGMLVFRNTRLADAVKEFNRYNTTKLVIADPSIADLKFTAELRTDHYEGFLGLAETVLNLRVNRQGNDILISRGFREKTKKTVRAKRSSSEAIAHARSNSEAVAQ